ncbi:hypothetical protein M3J09_002373 [Ascochyta lentis]
MPSPTQARTMFRSFSRHFTEAHTSSRNSASLKPYPPQYRVMFGKVARSTAFFLPGYFILLGWPLFPPVLFNGRM